jgi:hypothetical protein
LPERLSAQRALLLNALQMCAFFALKRRVVQAGTDLLEKVLGFAPQGQA